MNLKEKLHQEIIPLLQKKFNLKNPLAVPRPQKVVINIGVGEASQNKEILEKTSSFLTAITGQKPKVCTAKKAIAAFKLREGAPIGLKVTLRGERMYSFLEKLFKIILPRVRDFQGVKKTSFDPNGNYTLGIRDVAVFPEADLVKVDSAKGLEITIVTNSKDTQKSTELLALLGMPFEKN
jgi:large subunit ribosomal protein L5